MCLIEFMKLINFIILCSNIVIKIFVYWISVVLFMLFLMVLLMPIWICYYILKKIDLDVIKKIYSLWFKKD